MDLNELNDKGSPFGYPILTYVWVIGVACFGGIVKYLNKVQTGFSVFALVRDLVTAGFMGLITFWLCQWTNVTGPLSAVLIATAGLMGNKAAKELEYIYRLKFGLRYEAEDVSPSIEKALDSTEEK